MSNVCFGNADTGSHALHRSWFRLWRRDAGVPLGFLAVALPQLHALPEDVVAPGFYFWRLDFRGYVCEFAETDVAIVRALVLDHLQ